MLQNLNKPELICVIFVETNNNNSAPICCLSLYTMHMMVALHTLLYSWCYGGRCSSEQVYLDITEQNTEQKKTIMENSEKR